MKEINQQRKRANTTYNMDFVDLGHTISDYE